MKKLIFALLIVFASSTLFAQEKGLFLTLSGSAGPSKFLYRLESGSPKSGLGFGAGIGAQYFFTKNIGLSLGLEYTQFNTGSYFKHKGFDFYGLTDDEGKLCDIEVYLNNWNEKQKTHYIDIPLMFRFQQKWGKKEMVGFYFAFGPKMQIPISSSFERSDGTVSVYAYYEEHELTIGKPGYGVELPHHGIGTTEKFWKGKNEIKVGFAIAGEAGFLFGLSRRVDLTLGVSAEYGFTNIQKKSVDLLEVAPGKAPQDGEIADIVSYSGILNSNKINKETGIHPVFIRGHIGLRIKIGKLSEKKEEDDQDKKLDAILEKLSQPRDTIIINPVVVPVYLPAPETSTPEEGGPMGRRGTPIVTQEIIDELEEPIYFDLDKYNLDAEAIAILDRKIAQMKRYPQLSVSLVGHTCDLGTNPHNDELSTNRAQAARMYMIGKGIKPSRLDIIPMGKNFPSYPNTSEDSRRMNRRVDFVNKTK